MIFPPQTGIVFFIVINLTKSVRIFVVFAFNLFNMSFFPERNYIKLSKTKKIIVIAHAAIFKSIQ